MRTTALLLIGTLFMGITMTSFGAQSQWDSIYSFYHTRQYMTEIKSAGHSADLKMAENVLTEEAQSIEPWIIAPFAFEEEIGMESWMSVPFMVEEEIAMESWMSVPFLVEEEIVMESWMSASW